MRDPLTASQPDAATLTAVMYHYVGDFTAAGFGRLQALALDDFRRQLDFLQTNYEMATVESALAFARGAFVPRRPLCLLTFDDGLQGHCRHVAPLLAERKLEGVFFLVSGCADGERVAAVHKSHFLAARLGFEAYRAAFVELLDHLAPGRNRGDDAAAAGRTYRWDAGDIAAFKYLLNFVLEPSTRDAVLDQLFARHLGDDRQFARWLYLSWGEVLEMQALGMVIGGHSHTHRILARLDAAEQRDEIEGCAERLRGRLRPQAIWPFAYPYGKSDTYGAETIALLREAGFALAFTSTCGTVRPGDDVYTLARVDCNDVGIASRQALGRA